MQLRYCGLMYYNLIAVHPLNVLPRALCTAINARKAFAHDASHSLIMSRTANTHPSSPGIKHPPLKTPLRLLMRRR